jgi:hypothetical protein
MEPARHDACRQFEIALTIALVLIAAYPLGAFIDTQSRKRRPGERAAARG